MQTRILCLVATDFCCWAPITVMALLSFGGVPVPGTAYVVSAIILLPINSALNPIIYSDVGSFIFLKAKTLRRSSSLPFNSVSSTKQKFNRNTSLPGEKNSCYFKSWNLLRNLFSTGQVWWNMLHNYIVLGKVMESVYILFCKAFGSSRLAG